MKVKTSITLPNELLKAIDRLAEHHKNRSEFIEAAIRKYISELVRNAQDQHDLAIINEHADRLNEEAEDVLAYQVPL